MNTVNGKNFTGDYKLKKYLNANYERSNSQQTLFSILHTVSKGIMVIFKQKKKNYINIIILSYLF